MASANAWEIMLVKDSSAISFIGPSKLMLVFSPPVPPLGTVAGRLFCSSRMISALDWARLLAKIRAKLSLLMMPSPPLLAEICASERASCRILLLPFL